MLYGHDEPAVPPRPDPLAPLPPRPKPGQPPPGPDLSVCAHIYDAYTEHQRHCTVPPSVIFWIGCLRGEHAGPMSYCAAHATDVSQLRALTCAQCGGQVRIMKITSMDGESTTWTPDGPPPAIWREIWREPRTS